MSIVKRVMSAIYYRSRKQAMFLLSRVCILFHGNLTYEPFEHSYNCGKKSYRMTERGLEMFLVKKTLEKWGGNWCSYY